MPVIDNTLPSRGLRLAKVGETYGKKVPGTEIQGSKIGKAG